MLFHSRRASALHRLFMLAALGLALPASAQTLSGFQGTDNVTVSGAGTHGTFQGSAINNATTTYIAASAPGAAVTLNNGTFNLGAGGTLSGGATSQGDGLDVALGLGSTGGMGSGTVSITGGTITGFDAINVGGGTVTITGGNISSPIAGGGAGLVAQVSASNPGTGGTINLYGSNFMVNGMAAPSQLTGTTGTATGTVSGTLQNGDMLNTTYQLVGVGATINFIAAPEPAQWVVFGLGALVLVPFGVRARRRRMAA